MRSVSLLAQRMRAELGDDAVITDEAARRTYECDGLTHYRAIPALVVLPETAEQVQAAVRVCRERGIPWVARGSGTGLSGGALPLIGAAGEHGGRRAEIQCVESGGAIEIEGVVPRSGENAHAVCKCED